MLGKYLPSSLRRMKVADVRVTDIDDLHASLKKTPYQANRVLSALSKMFALAILWEMRPINSNPCDPVVRFPEKKRKRYASRDEASMIVERLRFYESQHPEQVAFLWLLFYTGARPGEIAAAMPEHLRGSKLVLTEHKTDGTGEDRVIQLPPQALAVLAKIKHRKGETLLRIKSARYLWAKIMAETGITKLRTYDLRHTFASIGLSNGKSLAQVGELLGHRSAETTKRYAHLIDEKASADASDIADAFDAFSKPKLRVVG